VIDLRCEQMIQHIHRGCEQHALVGLAGFRSDNAGEESLSHAGVADQYKVRPLLQKREIEQTQDAVLRLNTALVMVEVESVNGSLRLKTRQLEAALDGAAVAGIQFHIGEHLDRGGDAEVARGCLSDRRLDLAAHRPQVQLLQFLFECGHRVPFRHRG
jgi:hypothetical protein